MSTGTHAFRYAPVDISRARRPHRLIGRLARLLALTVVTLGVIAPLDGSPATATTGTTVPGGIIATDTTWTTAGSPWHITGTVQVASGATLTIAAGADVVSDAPIELHGDLVVAGTSADPARIQVASGQGLVSGIDGGGDAATRSVHIDHTDITGPGGLLAASPNPGEMNDLIVTNSTLTDMYGYHYIWYPHTVTFERNVFTRVNTIEVGTHSAATAVFRHNRFRGTPPGGFDGYNGESQLVSWAAYGEPMLVTGNVFAATTRPRLLEVTIDGAMDASGNWFGSTDPTQVGAWVWDQNDNLNSPSVIDIDPLLATPPAEVPIAAPTGPTAVVAHPGNASATVSWSAPDDDGGAPLASYTVTTSPGDRTVTVPGSATSVYNDGLTNGTAYTFTVVATNAIGTSPASTASNTVTPAAVPKRMRAPKVIVRGSKAIVKWTAAEPNGSPITRYKVDISKGKDKTLAASVRKAVFKGVKSGRYKVRITARNAIGTGPYSAWAKFRIR